MNDNHIEKVNHLLLYFRNFGELTPPMERMILSGSIIKKFARNKYLDSPLDEKPNIYFIIEGCVRGFVKEPKGEITTWISLENNIVGLTSFEKKYKVQRIQYIETIEETEVVILPYKLVMNLFASHSEMYLIGRNLLWQHYQELDEGNLLARLPTAEERLSRLLETRPEILDRVTLKYVANFLCIRIETLSRLRTRLSKRRLSE